MQRKIIIYILVLSFISASICLGQQPAKRVKIGYFEGGPYYYHKIINRAVKAELAALAGDSIEIIYEPHAYRSADWNRDICKSFGRDFARMKDIDMVIAVGPWVIEDLMNGGFKGAIIGLHQFDPYAQGLVDETGRSMAENLTVNFNSDKIESDLETIQKLFSPRRIGFLYFPSGDESDKVKSKLALAADRIGANIISSEEFTSDGQYSFFKSLGPIRENIDVLYLPPLWGVKIDQLQQFFFETLNGRVPTFSWEGYLILEKGATAANCVRPDLPLGRFTARKMMAIINGAKPASLPTVVEEAPSMCLNLEAARKLNISFSRSLVNNSKTIPAAPAENTPMYTFESAIDQGLRENAGVLCNGAVYEKALAAAGNAYSAFYPSIRLEAAAAASDNEAEAAVYNDHLNREFTTGITVDQKLYSYSAVRAIKIAKKNLEIEEANLERMKLDLKHAIATAYIAVIENEEREAAVVKKIDRLRTYWETALMDSQTGHTDTLDVLILQERLVGAKMLLHDIRSGLKISRVVLNVLLNRPGDDAVILDRADFVPELMVLMARKLESYTATEQRLKKFENYLVNFGMANSSEMQIAALSIGIQRDLISQHKKRYLPEITLRGRYSYSNEFEPEYGDGDDTWTIGGFLTLPLMTGSTWKNKGRSLQAGLDELLYEKDMIRFERMKDIITAAEKLTGIVATLPMSYFTGNLAEDNLEAGYAKYKAGEMSAVDLMSLDEHAFSMDNNLVDRKFKFFRYYAEMLHAVGAGYLIHNSTEETEFYKALEEYLDL